MGAREYLGSEKVEEIGVDDNVGILTAAIGKILADRDLGGVGLDFVDIENGQVHLIGGL